MEEKDTVSTGVFDGYGDMKKQKAQFFYWTDEQIEPITEVPSCYQGKYSETDFFYLSREGRMEIRLLRVFGGSRPREVEIQKRIIRSTLQQPDADRLTCLCIGDSIRMRYNGGGYWKYLYPRLQDAGLRIYHIPHNTQSSRLNQQFMDDWLSCKPQIITFNAGLHDVVRVRPDSEYRTPIAEYERNIYATLNKFRALGAMVFVVSSTPVHEEWRNNPRKQAERAKRGVESHFRYNKDIIEYNATLKTITEIFNFEYINTYSVLWEAGTADVLRPGNDGVHLTSDGEVLCSNTIFDALSARIGL